MSAESIITQIMVLLNADAGLTNVVKRDYWDETLSVDQWRSGTVEIDLAPTFSGPSNIHEDGLDRVPREFHARISKATAGTPKDARAGVVALVETFKSALETSGTDGNLGHGYVRRGSLKFGKEKWSAPGQVNVGPFASLSKRSVIVPFSVIEYQMSASRA